MSEKKISHGTPVDMTTVGIGKDRGNPATQAIVSLAKAIETANARGAELSIDSIESLARDVLAVDAGKFIEKSVAERNLLDRRFEAYIFQMRDTNAAAVQLASSIARLGDKTAEIRASLPAPARAPSRLSWHRRGAR